MAVPHQVQIRDVTYLNWVRAVLGLLYTQKGLESFINNEAKVFHSSLLNQLGQQPQNCGQCTVDNLLPHQQSSCPRRTNCICSRGPRNMRRLCPNNVCGTLFNAIVSEHRFKGPSLKNSNISQWVTDHWEVAKIFLPNTGGYKNIATATDTDLSGLVSIGINMSSIAHRHNLTVSGDDGPDYFIKCRTARNTILHRHSMSLADDELTDYLNDMKATLQCTAALLNDATAQQAVTKLTQLRETSSFKITDENITEVRRMLLAKQDEGHKQVEALKEEFVKSLPSAIQAMDKDAIELYRKALEDGKESVFDIRLKLVGHQGVGKTSLAKRLLGKTVDPHERIPTDGIDVHIGHCRISLETGEWISSDEDCSLDTTKERLLKAVSDVKSQAEELKNDFQETKESPAVRSNMEMEITQPDNTENVNDVLEPAKVTPKTCIDIPAATAKYRQNSISDANLKAYIEKTLGETIHLQEKENHAKVSIWDFAGQTVFYNTHQIFLSPRSIYLLVINIEESLDSDIPIDQNDCMPSKKSKTKKVSDFLEFWLNSIRFFCNESDSVNDPPADSVNNPPVILVATHADCLGKDKTIAEEKTDTYFENIRMLFMSKETGYQIVDDADIAVDNLIEDPNIEVLKKTIYEEAKKQKHWGEQRPTRWITLEKALFKQKRNGKKVIRRSELEDMNEKLPMPLPKPEELELFLRFHNDIGNFLHFNDEELKDHVVLDPQWLVDAFKCIVTTGQQKTKKNRLLGPWKEFTTTGKLSRTLLDFVLEKKFKENLNIIVIFFERLGIIAKPADDADYFFAPCFLGEPPESIFSSIDSDRTTNRLCLSTDNGFLPEILFNRLLAACISKYKIFKEQLFCCCGEFKYDQKHTFTVFYMNNLIKIWVISHDPKKPSPNTQVCEDIRRVMVQHLVGLCKLKDERKIEMYIDCPRVGVKTQKCLHKVSILRKEEGVICENCPDGHHYIESEEALKHWFPQENTNQNKKEDLYQSKEDGTEISRREERQNLHTSPGCFIQLDGKNTVEPTKETKLMVKWFDSVCQICWNGGTATGFRVGPCYIMTALHVVDMITKQVFQSVVHTNDTREKRLTNDDVFAVFDYECDGYQPHKDSIFYFKGVIHFEDRNTDSAVLELLPNTCGTKMPQPFEYFADLGDNMAFKFVGHDRAEKKASQVVKRKKNVTETYIQNSRDVCANIGLKYEVEPFQVLKNPDRYLFDSIFTKGASGSPGIIVSGEKTIVVTMLLCGYPDGYYDINEPPIKKSKMSPTLRIEQGANMKSIYETMKRDKPDLCGKIFK